jgi:hypothetical protein
MNLNINTPIKALCTAFQTEFGAGIKYYGEAVRNLSDNQAANYVTADGYDICSVDDNYEQTIFIVRESADTATQLGGGRVKNLSRTVKYTLAANTKLVDDEYRIAVILNQVLKLTYEGSSFDQGRIANSYFGIKERNTQSAFFTCSFSVLETINCLPC